MSRSAALLAFLLATIVAQPVMASEGETAADIYARAVRRLERHKAGWYRNPADIFTSDATTRELFESIRNQYPHSPEAALVPLRIGDTWYYAEDNCEEALSYYEEYLASPGSGPLHDREVDHARKMRDYCAKKVPTAEKLYEDGMRRLEIHRQSVVWNPARWRWNENPIARAITNIRYDTEETRRLFQEIRRKHPVSSQAPLATLRIADVYFEEGAYVEAQVYYDEFIRSHPAFREEAAYAQMRRAQCFAQQMLDHDRDPSAALNAREAFATVQRDYPATPEGSEAAPALQEVTRHIGEQEAFVADFYYRRSQYQAAMGRYRGLIEQFPGHPLTGWALYRLGRSAEHIGDFEGARRYYEQVLALPDDQFRHPRDVKWVDAWILFLAYPNADATPDGVRRRARLRIAVLDLLPGTPKAN